MCFRDPASASARLSRLLGVLVRCSGKVNGPGGANTTGPARLKTARVEAEAAWPPRSGRTGADLPVISRCFPASRDQVRHARDFVAQLLGGGHPLCDDAVLLTSELATNAVEHATGPNSGPREFLVTVTFVEHGVLITVQDPGSAHIPCPRTPEPDAVGGRGLTLVNTLAVRWGFHRDSIGTVIWFELSPPA
ncbi:ATP-binding protein [Streptosporangium sp. NBC_01756]|uniref:ATP-binding protein n=1 Tax=Streptosporangium sp. NBC_01756 TaxID=2975950 RepID=UPI002DDA8622|nr:ATP-binding protein [Streptosporangium sp. NBC_01756]WSC89647.1 ATP-binding protein [Streptosporangium sp. NBC_01756]